MQAAIIHAPGNVTVETVPDPVAAPNDVIIEVAACGICGTDLHILEGEFAPSFPVIPGHEFAGVVVDTGKDVTSLKVGDRVAVNPSFFCGECYFCRKGQGNLCDKWGAIGISAAGGAAEYAVAPIANCWLLPEHVEDVRDATLIEPLACAVRGFDVLPRVPGSHYLIYGAGTMGLLMLELAKRNGAATVSMVDLNAQRLETAAVLGCDSVSTSADTLDRPRGWSIVIDCTGNPAAIADGLKRVEPGGTFLQFGVAGTHDKIEIEPFWIYNKEITITGSMAVLNSYERAGELFASGLLNADVMISDRLPLSQYPQALDQFAKGVGRKIQVVP